MKGAFPAFLKKYLTPSNINKFWFIYYAVGVIGFTIPMTRNFFRDLIGLSILLSLTLMFYFHRPWNSRFIIASFIVIFGGFFIEAAGVGTGLIFGEYSYGEILGPGLLNTPFLIGLNWWMLIYIVSQVMRQSGIKAIGQITLGAAIMVGYDVFLEPVAIATGMWDWNGHGIPFQNYLAWFVISFVFLSVFRGLKTEYQNPVAVNLLSAQTIFFILLNVIHQISGL